MSRISAIVLAAGAARRFGRPKQLVRWPDENSPTLVERAVSLALQTGVAEVIVVTGNHHSEVENALAAFNPVDELFPETARSISPATAPVRLVYNEKWQEGQGFSVSAGIKAVKPEVAAAIFILADQPRVKPETIQKLLDHFEQWDENSRSIIFPTYQGKRGNPVLFGSDFFTELADLNADSGGREVVRAHPESVLELEVDDPAIHEDIDTPDDLARLYKVPF